MHGSSVHWNTLTSKGRGMKQYYARGKSCTNANYEYSEALKPRGHVVKQRMQHEADLFQH